jgi:hypothetical protein
MTGKTPAAYYKQLMGRREATKRAIMSGSFFIGITITKYRSPVKRNLKHKNVLNAVSFLQNAYSLSKNSYNDPLQ